MLSLLPNDFFGEIRQFIFSGKGKGIVDVPDAIEQEVAPDMGMTEDVNMRLKLPDLTFEQMGTGNLWQGFEKQVFSRWQQFRSWKKMGH